MRPSRIMTFMECAHVFAKRATCHRLNVGAVIVLNRNIVSHGYNGPPAGEPHCTGNDCPGKALCKLTTHAEKNAIDRLAPEFREIRGRAMFCTDSPCEECAYAIIQERIDDVFFAIPYRLMAGTHMLINAGISVYRVTPAGYVIDYKTREVMDFDV